jgi:hypothetical protein
MENSDLITVAASIAVIVWSLVMNTLYNAEQHRENEKLAIEARTAVVAAVGGVSSRLRGGIMQQQQHVSVGRTGSSSAVIRHVYPSQS